MKAFEFTLSFSPSTYTFNKKDIPNELPSNSTNFFISFVNELNKATREERNSLLEFNSSCISCCCYFSAFTIIGTIPFFLWKCQRNEEKNDIRTQLLKKFESLKSELESKLNNRKDIKITFKETKTNNKNFNFSYTFHIIIFNPNFHYQKLNFTSDNHLRELNELLETSNDKGASLREQDTIRPVNNHQDKVMKLNGNGENNNLQCYYNFSNNQINYAQNYPANNGQIGMNNIMVSNYQQNQNFYPQTYQIHKAELSNTGFQSGFISGY